METIERKSSQKQSNTVPNSPETEGKVISEILFDPLCLQTVIDMINPSCFYNEGMRQTYEAMLKLNEKNIKIDTVSLYEELKKEGVKANVKSLMRLGELSFSSAMIEHDCKILIEYWMKREIIKSANKLLEKAKEDSSDPFELLSETSEEIFKIENHIDSITLDKNMWEEYQKIIADIEEKWNGKGEGGLMSSSFPSMNKATGGIMPTDYVIVYGMYKQGKTTVAEQIMIDIALQSKAVGIFSLEMDKQSIYYKALSMRTGIDYLKLRNPKGQELTKEEFYEFDTRARQVFSKTKIYVEDKLFDIDRILSKMKIWKKKFNIKLFCIDYLGLMKSDERFEARYRQLSEYSSRFKMFAKMNEVPVMLLTQANKENRTAESLNPARDGDFIISVSKPSENGVKNIRKKDGGFYNFTEDDFLITMENSRHGRNKQNFVAKFSNNNFVEWDIERDLI